MTYLPYLQIIISILLVAAILLQQRGTALGSAFGGGGEAVYASRRGLQKKLFWGTVALAVVFIVLAVLNLIV